MKGYASYQNTKFQDASREVLLLEMVQGAIRNVKGARKAWTDGDQGAARERLSRALAIVLELDNTLDRDGGGQVVEQLESLYAYMERELMAANEDGEFERLDPVQEVLETLYRGWSEAADQYRQMRETGGQPATETAGAPSDAGSIR